MSTRTIEITAKTEAEARQIATGELNSNEEIVNAETLSAPAKGLFGLVGKQEYKIRFTIGEKPEEKVEAQVERLTGRPSENSDEDEFAEEDGSAPAKSNRREWAPRRNSRRERPERGGRRNNRHYRNDFRAEGDSAEEKIEIPERPKEPVSEEIKNHEGYGQIFDLIRGVAENVGIENVQLVDYMRDGAWVIEASAEDVSQLIGKRGHTLDSLQYLMNIIFNKNSDDDRIKIVLDAQGYREKRYQNLIHLANRMAKKAVASHRPIELEPMSTLDRRTIHMALKDRTDVETFSKGSEPMRRVVISSLKKKNNRPNNAEWQPLAIDDEGEVSDRTEGTSSVPMFMEEDA